ncbi:hypothetical protein IL306_008518 [Fusarium sp. DS 682]|nr:hypothetical protein IL306_008518 [Fusarium sp. DS 682]
MVWNAFMQEHGTLRTGIDQEEHFPLPTNEYFAQEFAGPVLLSAKNVGGEKVRIEVHTNFKILMTFFPFQDTGRKLVDRDDLTSLLLREIVSDSASKSSLSLAKEWLDDCITSHERCFPFRNQTKLLPTRVIDVGSSTSSPHLHMTGSIRGKWTALSYSWGGISSFALTQSSLERLENGLPLKEFPATIRDAIVVTRALDIQYLWVDSLCILQDSPEDWSREAPKMDDIYSHAEVVIAATASNNVNSGLFKIRSQLSSCLLPWNTLQEYDGTGKQQYIGVQPSFDYFRDHLYIPNYHWATRGWTMQESLLASRVLSYTRGQIGWECLSLSTTESGGDDRWIQVREPADDTASKVFKRITANLITGDASELESDLHLNRIAGGFHSLWYSLVQYYSWRKFTVPSDRLPALAGLATRFQRVFGDEYYAGLWKGDLLRGLLWSHGRWGSDKGGLRGENIGPSWSWASLEGELDTWPDEIVSEAKVINVHVDVLGDNGFSQVNGGKLIIEAPFFSWDHSGTVTTALQRFVTMLVAKPDSSAGAEYRLRHRPYVGQHFAVILISSNEPYCHSFLLLETVQGFGSEMETVDNSGDRAANEPQYRRVCMFTFRDRDEFYEEWKRGDLSLKTVVIV